MVLEAGDWPIGSSTVDLAGPAAKGGGKESWAIGRWLHAPVTRSVKRGAILLGIAALATIGLIVMGVRQSMHKNCEVCVTFQGRTECRVAAGATEEEATTTAIQNACAFVAAGMTQTVQCQNRAPDSIVCD